MWAGGGSSVASVKKRGLSNECVDYVSNYDYKFGNKEEKTDVLIYRRYQNMILFKNIL